MIEMQLLLLCVVFFATNKGFNSREQGLARVSICKNDSSVWLNSHLADQF